MRQVYLEQRSATGATEHNKFYRLTDDGSSVLTEWGAIGASGQSKVISIDLDPTVREAVFNKKLKEKEGRGYVVQTRQEASSTGAGPVHVEARPSAEGRRWGLEVETHSNVDIHEVAAKMMARGLRVNVEAGRYFQSDGQAWDLKRDGSCGYELASPILGGEAGVFNSKLAVEKIREVCPTAVNHSCGIHVTIDIADHSPEDLKRLAIGYLRAQEFFYQECAEWRQNNQYCRRNPIHSLEAIVRTPASQIQKILDLAGGWRNHENRYHGLNFTRMFSRKVVEFRMMESTVDIRKVGGWIRMCVGFVDGLKKSMVTFKSTSPFTRETFDKIIAGTFSA
jgi:predicted DNA-binding WGR domain protein